MHCWLLMWYYSTRCLLFLLNSFLLLISCYGISGNVRFHLEEFYFLAPASWRASVSIIFVGINIILNGSIEMFSSCTQRSSFSTFSILDKIESFWTEKWGRSERRFFELAGSIFTFVSNWDNNQIQPNMARVFSRKMPAKDATAKYVEMQDINQCLVVEAREKLPIGGDWSFAKKLPSHLAI